MQNTLELPGNLQHLIFGHTRDMPRAQIPTDPLTRFFRSKGWQCPLLIPSVILILLFLSRVTTQPHIFTSRSLHTIVSICIGVERWLASDCGMLHYKATLVDYATLRTAKSLRHKSSVSFDTSSCMTQLSYCDRYAAEIKATETQKEIVVLTGKAKKLCTFSWVVKHTCEIAVGPFEYCGNARVIKMLNGKTM